MAKPHDETFTHVLKLYGIDPMNVPEDGTLLIGVGEAVVEQFVRDSNGGTVVNHDGTELIREYATYPSPRLEDAYNHVHVEFTS